ncbi:MAG: FkbM family methyltransferase [Candidatus Bathyarchaeia archaeon]
MTSFNHVSSMTTFTPAAPYELTNTRHGLMLVNRNDVYMGQAYLLYGECCQLESQFLLALAKNPGLVIEVGANMGVHTVPIAAQLAKQNRTLFAFEPQPVIFQQLCANLALNGLMNVRAFPYACGNESGAVTFEIPDYHAAGNFGSTSMSDATPASPRHALVQCVRLDSIAAEEPVGLIKVDVEGYELEVLKGAEGILARCHPLLYVENDRVENSPPLIQWLLDRDYRLWWHLPPLFNPQNFRGIAENHYGEILSLNMLCIPKSLPIPIEGLIEILDCNDHPLAPNPAPKTS